MGELNAFVKNKKNKKNTIQKKIHVVSVLTKIDKHNSQFYILLLVSLLLSLSQNKTSFVLLLLLLFEQLIKICM